MGMENDAMLDFLRDDRRFADLFNGGLFDGECVVVASELQEAGENYTQYRDESNDVQKKHKRKQRKPSVTRTRDIKKRLKSGAELRILAVEEQSIVDYTMPWRCMNYDALEYGRQVRNRQRENESIVPYESEKERLCRFRKTDRLSPVYTVCLYHGAEIWDGARSLQEMIEFGSDNEKTMWEQKFSDYRMQLICVNELRDFTKFTTELKELFGIMAFRRDKQGMKRFLEEHDEYKRLNGETARAIGAVMGVSTFMENDERFKTKGGYDMCQAIKEMWMDGWNDGVNEGISQGISQGISRGVNLSALVFRTINSGFTDNWQIAELCECTVDDVVEIRTVFGI
ncbi:MAG: hypothetical protein IJA58_03835 [Lachnospiraceae bacterium]|nr:hypothetical protein [Lachnospiraceae bacterium]